MDLDNVQVEGDSKAAEILKPFLGSAKNPECKKEKGNPGRNFCVHNSCI